MSHARRHRVATLFLAAVAVVACGGRVDAGADRFADAGDSFGSSDGEGGTSYSPSTTAGNSTTTGGAESNAIGGALGSSDAGSNEDGLQRFERRCPEDVPVPTTPCGSRLCEVFQPDLGEVAADCIFHSARVAQDATRINVFFDCIPQPVQTVDGSLQWKYFEERNASRIEFHAETCAAIRARNMSVLDIAFGCPICLIM